MKFGKHLDDNRRDEWEQNYLDYKSLKDLIKESAQEQEENGRFGTAYSPRVTSLSVLRADRVQTADERFFQKLDTEIKKVNDFTLQLVENWRRDLKKLSVKVHGKNREKEDDEALIEEARRIGGEFLSLEKYVNLNYMGFHKILKKHDKMVPTAPCQQYYLAQLHSQPWTQGTYSDLLVVLSNIYSTLRGDASGVKNEDSAQGFVRSTTKYWVRTADVSQVKHIILQHLPVFQFKDEGEGQQDSQLINSVYLDNTSLELYHGRLDKRPNAIAIRLRWYGQGVPRLVFVERKTHRESWKGEESVKERITLAENLVLPFLEGKYTIEQAQADLRAKNKTQNEIDKFSRLFVEIQQQVDSKQLHPMIRTQYMRTAFQIPYDASVRISLDTNLTMIRENPEDGPLLHLSGRWYRDPHVPLPRTEVTRFPHAVLEVKLSLPEGQTTPAWVQDLLEPDTIPEVHKFSKFIHGTATLLPDMVQAVPYWIDEGSLRESVLNSAPTAAAIPQANQSESHATASLLAHPQSASKPRRRVGLEDNTAGHHPLLGDHPTLQLMPPDSERTEFGKRKSEAGGGLGGFLERWFNAPRPMPAERTAPRTTPMRIEPKTFFANERTFLTWLHMAVTVGTIAAGLLGFAGTAARGDQKPHSRAADSTVELIALILLPLAIAMSAYALLVFLVRGRAIQKKSVGYIDDRFGPYGLATAVVCALTAILILSAAEFVGDLRAMHSP